MSVPLAELLSDCCEGTSLRDVLFAVSDALFLFLGALIFPFRDNDVAAGLTLGIVT